MKKRFCMAAAACLLLSTGCGESSYPPVYEPTANHTNPPETMLNTQTTPPDTETAAADDDLQRRLDAIASLTPQPIPEDGWTDETLLPLISIGGEPAKLPFCLADLLIGYETDGEFADYYTEHAAEVFSHEITYAGNQCYIHNAFGELEFPARTESHNPALPDGADDHELTLNALWCITADDGSARYPFSVNCVTVGSTLEELTARIGTSDQDSIPDQENSDPDALTRFHVRCSTETVSIMFSGDHDTVDTIILYDRNE